MLVLLYYIIASMHTCQPSIYLDAWYRKSVIPTAMHTEHTHPRDCLELPNPVSCCTVFIVMDHGPSSISYSSMLSQPLCDRISGFKTLLDQALECADAGRLPTVNNRSRLEPSAPPLSRRGQQDLGRRFRPCLRHENCDL